MKRFTLLVVILMFLPVLASAQSCLVVRQAEGHRFRNSMIAGALTGGVGLAAGLAFSGAKYEYVDAYNVPNPKMKYKGDELQKLQSQGVHIIIVEKAKKGISTADEVKDARDTCKNLAPPPASQSATVPAKATQQPVVPAPAVATTAPQPAQQQEEPLGDIARRYQQQPQQQQQVVVKKEN